MRTTVMVILVVFGTQLGWGDPVIIRFIDKSSEALTPVRVELLDKAGEPLIADNAIPLSSDCAFAPLPNWLSQPPKTSLLNPFTGTHQHYVAGVGRYQLEPGEYRLRVFKGSEFKVSERQLVVSEHASQFHVEMERWHESVDAAWVSSDVHLHIGRGARESDTIVAQWMAAEDLHIANLLQMGALTHFAASPQYSFDESRRMNSLLVPGQEHPRTHLLGHSLSLGGSRAVDERASYIQYDRTFRKVRAAGGINGFAHWGAGPSRDGIALNAHLGNVEILEVLGVGALYIDTWYELLNMGFRIAAVAGTDFPCLAGIPGRERTYLQIDRELSRAGMVDALRQGRTFVTNGPMLRFSVEEADIGAHLELEHLDSLHVRGELHYDANRDSMQGLELVHNGDVIRAWDLTSEQGSFQFSEVVSLPSSGWIALRAGGVKLGETLTTSFPAWMSAGFSNWMAGANAPEIDELLEGGQPRRSYAHTSPIYVESNDYPQPKVDPTSWLTRLDELETMLRREDHQDLLIWDWMPYSDGVSEDHIRLNTSQLLEQIRGAREDFVRRRNLQ